MRTWWFGLSVGALLGVVAILGLEQQARQPRTHREAVMRLLEAQGISYHDVQVTSVCSFDPRDCAVLGSVSYAVVIHGARRATGRITCAPPDEGGTAALCSLSLPDLGVIDVPLPRLARPPGWLGMYERGRRVAEELMRELGW